MKRILLLFIISGLIVTLACKQNKNEASKDSKTIQTGGAAAGEIVYVNVDTLLKYYTFYQDQKKVFEGKAKSSEGELQTRSLALQKKGAEFQDKVQRQVLTQRQADETNQQLMIEQQNLLALRDNIQQQLASDEQILSKQLNDSIQSFLKRYNKEKKYKLIISTATGSPILLGDEKLDITQEVLKGLNQHYLKKK